MFAKIDWAVAKLGAILDLTEYPQTYRDNNITARILDINIAAEVTLVDISRQNRMKYKSEIKRTAFWNSIVS